MYSGGLNTVRDASQWESLSCLVRSGTTGGTLGAEAKINAELSGYKMGFLFQFDLCYCTLPSSQQWHVYNKHMYRCTQIYIKYIHAHYIYTTTKCVCIHAC